MTAPSPGQLEIWQSFKAVFARADLEVNITSWTAENCAMAVQFAHSKNLAPTVDITGLLSELQAVRGRREKLKEAILGVELEKLGLRFQGGDIDLMAESGTSGDVVAHYQLTGWHIILAGIVVGGAIIAYMAALRHQNHELHGKLSGITDDMNALLCGDSSSALCAEWEAAREQNGYNQRENMIDQAQAAADALPDVVKKAASWGLSIGIPLALVAAVFLWRDK